MLTKEQYLNLHGQFYDSFISTTGSYFSYDRYSIVSYKSKELRWPIFHAMAKDFIRELLNAINGYCTDLRKLESWNSVLERCENEYKFDFITEIINPFASYTLNYVSVIKQRMIYTACMLSHQTAMLLDPSIRDKDLVEHQIKFKSLKAYSDHYTHMNAFRKALKQIDSDSFRNRTSNFRNLYHHRIPPGFELGLSGSIKRVAERNKNVSYDFGGIQPLRIGELIPLLYEQYQANISAFQIFWDLVKEQVSIWEKN
ncbi:hypothetical protein DENIS_2481 [Desulfonema ishimotonii]|uniref:Cthe-2314-like HEPN domain-containing protein n=1 Tax=Desulfonema ishimotonii TaxID=45657 RepID=A0A401FX49_9BACT|nr:hypothetical protein [Desulfonema ishimotonii]GBC61519.1 hypothetical protein DENIS_2481 [Desulfonema ishimotonii]